MLTNLKIKKGSHYPNNWFYRLYYSFYKVFFNNKHKELQVKVNFGFNCLYDLKDGVKKELGDINKLFGFSLGNHDKESLRIGWRSTYPESNKIEIFSFIHHESNFFYKKICEIKCGIEYVYKIEINVEKNNFIYKIKIWDINHKLVGSFISESLKLDRKIIFSWNLSPYFGGNLPSPHDMDIFFELIK